MTSRYLIPIFFLEKYLKWSDKLFLWLDYDSEISLDIVSDIELVAAKAKPYDILLITVDADSPPDPKDVMHTFSRYIPPNLTGLKIKRNFPGTLNGIMTSATHNGLNMRTNRLSFFQLFNMTYKDSSWMYTWGGIFCDKSDIRKFQNQLDGLRYIKHDQSIEIIDCPLLTPKEKMYLDSRVIDERIRNPGRTGIIQEQVDRYALYYKYYPQFFESIY